MFGTWLFIRSRLLFVPVVAGLLAVLAARTFISTVVEVAIDPDRPARFVNMLELLPIANVVAWTVAIGPRFPVWEHLGGSRYRLHAAAAAAATVIGPQLVVLAALTALPDRTPTWQVLWIPVNLACWSGVALVASALFGRFVATATVVAGFAAVVAAQSMFALRWLPLAYGGDPSPRWVTCLAACIIGLVVYIARGGTSIRALQRHQNAE